MPAHAVDQVEARIAELVEQRRPQMAELVRRAVDVELERLVDAELQNHNAISARIAQTPLLPINGKVRTSDLAEVRTPGPTVGPGLRRCRHCNESKPLDQFGPHRHVCRTCRADQQARARERRTQPAEQGDAPRPGTAGT